MKRTRQVCRAADRSGQSVHQPPDATSRLDSSPVHDGRPIQNATVMLSVTRYGYRSVTLCWW
jgi:hypothetical protein